MLSVIRHSGVDRCRFNMTRAEIEVAVGTKPHRGRRNQYELSDHDYYVDLGMFVYYDNNDQCCAIEFTADADVEVEGERLMKMPMRVVLAWAKARDPSLVPDAEGFESPALGLSVYAPYADKRPSEPPMSLLIFRPGYYEEKRARLEEFLAQRRGTGQS